MKSIACVIWYTALCVLRMVGLVILVPLIVLMSLVEWAIEGYQDWKDSLSKGERSDPLGRERDDDADPSQD